MNERRRFRRSSPDAPQGMVPVLAVLVGLAAVVVLTGVGFAGSDRSSSVASDDDPVVARGSDGVVGSTTAVPTTALISGSTSTTLFVTTTTPITTTTSTTSTTLPGPALDPGGPEVVFGPGQLSVSFTVRSADPVGLEFDVTAVPDGMTASPIRATVSASVPVTITLQITDPNRARGGTLVLVGGDGTRVPVRVTVQSQAFTVASVSFDPSPPVCGAPARLIALVSGTGVTSVSATISSANGRTTLPMGQISNGAWSVALPGAPTGSTLSGTVVATDAEGRTAARTFSTVISGAPGCRR
ncbi:MAG TPA: hypothetical protein VFN21_00130 [Acidimicrobiales bacterium]|nr:hypothetical protein [Acidimicrobiales bacterium]